MRGLRFHCGDLPDPSARYARERLLRDVLGLAAADAGAGTNPWLPFALFDAGGRCVANIEASILPLGIAGQVFPVAGLRSVAVAADRRGEGLFRWLMQEALTWCDREGAGAVLLYTEDPDLYRRFGFAPQAQHAFLGPVPASSRTGRMHAVDLGTSEDAALVRTLVETRAPLSSLCTLGVDAAQTLANLGKDEGFRLAYAPMLDALVVYEENDQTLVVADVFARTMPDASKILGALGLRPRRLKTLFPPDRIGWSGDPVAEDTGLMVRGPLPAALDRPFMIPPTAEF